MANEMDGWTWVNPLLNILFCSAKPWPEQDGMWDVGLNGWIG